jgi:predicted nucleic acid-binding protein
VDRVFLDANVLLSAALRPKAGLLRLWTLANAALITSDHAIEEARRNLDAPGQRARLTRREWPRCDRPSLEYWGWLRAS